MTPPDTAGAPSRAARLAAEARAIGSALQFATRLPLPDPGWEPGRLTRAAPWLPLAGLVVGGIGALVLLAAAAVLPPGVSAGLAIAAMLAATGALHEDGFADLADAAGSRAGPARALEIMRDSRLGSFGVLALVLLVGLRWQALAALLAPPAAGGGGIGGAAAALVLAAIAGRAAMLAVMRHPGPARAEGLAATLLGAEGEAAAAAALGPRLWLSAGLTTLLVAALAGVAGLLAAAAALVAAAVVACLARRRLGGHTGDSLGAAAAAGETAALIAFAALPPTLGA